MLFFNSLNAIKRSDLDGTAVTTLRTLTSTIRMGGKPNGLVVDPYNK